MHDNLLWSTNSLSSTVTNLRKKLNGLKSSLDSLTSALDTVEDRILKVQEQADIYKVRLKREYSKEVKALNKEIEELKAKLAKQTLEKPSTPEQNLQIAATFGIFDTLLRLMCEEADDFRTACEAFLFPAVLERVVEGTQEAYFLEEVPPSLGVVIARGKEYIKWIRSEASTYFTVPDVWEKHLGEIVKWWSNDALPLLYGARDDQWDTDEPLSLKEMLVWKENPGERPLLLPAIFDGYEIYRKHKDEIYSSSGLRKFEFQAFKFKNNFEEMINESQTTG